MKVSRLGNNSFMHSVLFFFYEEEQRTALKAGKDLLALYPAGFCKFFFCEFCTPRAGEAGLVLPPHCHRRLQPAANWLDLKKSDRSTLTVKDKRVILPSSV